MRKTSPGYIAESHILNAKDFGIPQNRERLFFIGVRTDINKKYSISPQKIFIDILKVKNKFKLATIADAIYDLPQIKNNPKPNNYKTKDEIPFEDKNTFGMNVSNLDYNTLINTNNNIYVERINCFKGKNIEPSNLYNHKSRYHNKRDKYIYMNLSEGSILTILITLSH